MSTAVKRNLKAINNKLLVEEVVSFVDDAIINFGVNWESDAQRESFVEHIKELMSELVEEERIEQFKVVCDRRNNSSDDMLDGIFKFDVHFKQRNCLNTTKVLYTIRTNSEEMVHGEPDFII